MILAVYIDYMYLYVGTLYHSYPRSDVHRFVFACGMVIFLLILSTSLPRNIEFGSIPEFETPAVPPLSVSGIGVISAVSSGMLVWQDCDP